MRHALLAIAAFFALSVPASAQTSPYTEFTAPIESAVWDRKVEIWQYRRNSGRSGGGRWVYRTTERTQGAYPDMPFWPRVRLHYDSNIREQNRHGNYILNLRHPDTGEEIMMFVNEETWATLVKAGEVEVMTTRDGRFIPVICRVGPCF